MKASLPLTWCAALGMLMCWAGAAGAGEPASSQPASSQPAIALDELPPPGSFTVADKPGDDGSDIIVEWGRPRAESDEASYIVEVAQSPEGFDKGEFKSTTIERGTYRAEINPASPEFFPPPSPPPLSARRLRQLADEKVLTADESERAQHVMAARAAARPAATTLEATSRPETPTKADQEWFAKLAAYLASHDWIATFATGPKPLVTRDQLARAQAALAARFRQGDAAPEMEQDWLKRLTAFLKRQERDAQQARAAEINRQPLYFRLAVARGGQKAYVSEHGRPIILSGAAKPNWFNPAQLNMLVFAVVFCGIVFTFIQVAKRRPNLFIRKIAGLEAVDDAIGRATELGKPIYFVHGLGGMGDQATIASVSILGRVGGRAAEFGTRIRVMNNDPIVTAVSQEVVQQAFKEAGRPDAYSPDDVALVASDQFSYVAAVSGSMVREQPGAVFMMGSFFAESLLLAETGASTGAIQVAGTDAYTQLPFFITTCDYTLIGEELYAASAYLSREPRMLGSLRGQDVGKAFLMLAIVASSLALTVVPLLNKAFRWRLDLNWLRNLFSAGS